MAPPNARRVSPSISHFVIFSPSLSSSAHDSTILSSPTPPRLHDEEPIDGTEGETEISHGDQLPGAAPAKPTSPKERDRDLEEDLREAAQILFYTSREAGGVSRDKMLRQVGLAKGLMSFTGLAIGTPDAEGSTPVTSTDSKWWGIHTQRSRMIVFMPEQDFYIYANITLAHGISIDQEGKTHVESIATSQGIPDQMIVDALQRGYKDFRLLHSTFTSLMPPSSSLSTTLDKYWTRFVLSLESTYLSPALEDQQLPAWLAGYPTAPEDRTTAASSSISALRSATEVAEDTVIGLIVSTGPLYISHRIDDALLRFLAQIVQASLPPPPAPIIKAQSTDTRTTLGFGLGRRKGKTVSDSDERRSSWNLNLNPFSGASAWVPGLGGSRSTTPVPAGRASLDPTPIASPSKATASSGEAVERKEPKARWPSLGLGGFGEAMGSVGEVFGLGSGSKTPDLPEQRTTMNDPEPEHSLPDGSGVSADITVPVAGKQDSDNHTRDTTTTETSSEEGVPAPAIEQAIEDGNIPSEVEQSEIVLPDLQAAVQGDQSIELTWERKTVWTRDDHNAFAPCQLNWLITADGGKRDGTLLFMLHASNSNATPDALPSQAVLDLFASLGTSLLPSRISRDIPRPSTPVVGNAWLYHQPSTSTLNAKGEIDPISMRNLTELKDVLSSDNSIHEIYAQGKTADHRFVVAKKLSRGDGEVYAAIGRKDASLTDAEQAIRSIVVQSTSAAA